MTGDLFVGYRHQRCSADTRQTAHRGKKCTVQSKIAYLSMFFLTSREISSDMYACNLTSEVIHMASLEFI